MSTFKKRCLGTSQYLKEKFGMGYTLEFKINMAKITSFFVFIERLAMQRATLIENFADKYIYNIPKDCIQSLASTFERLDRGSIKIL